MCGVGGWRREEQLRQPRAAKRRECLLVGKLHLLYEGAPPPPCAHPHGGAHLVHTLRIGDTLKEVHTLREGARSSCGSRALQSEKSASWWGSCTDTSDSKPQLCGGGYEPSSEGRSRHCMLAEQNARSTKSRCRSPVLPRVEDMRESQHGAKSTQHIGPKLMPQAVPGYNKGCGCEGWERGGWREERSSCGGRTLQCEESASWWGRCTCWGAHFPPSAHPPPCAHPQGGGHPQGRSSCGGRARRRPTKSRCRSPVFRRCTC